jgi:hypothetical protein
MKTRTASLIIWFALICLTAPSAFGQHRFDVTIEGPWILYELKKFDGTNSMLVAMAPSVPGHHAPVLTTGDGGQITTFGIYCVAFGGPCQANATPFPKPGSGSGTYDQTNLLSVAVYGNNLAWSTIQSNSIAFLLPMPDAISNDGIDPKITTRSDFSSYPGTSPSAIGVQLHYNNGPSFFNLFTCANTPPPNATCTTPAIQGTFSNSGTLRITMKAEEHTDAQDPCDYHVRMAYHSMLMFLDPTQLQQHPTAGRQNANQSIAYMEHADTTSVINNCRLCDPQLESIPSSCAYVASYGHGQMSELDSFRPALAIHNVAPVLIPTSPSDLGSQLDSLNTLLAALKGKLDTSVAAAVEPHGSQDISKKRAENNTDIDSCSAPDAKLPDLKGKFPTLSQLTCVERYLESRARDLERSTCRDQKTAQNGSVELPCEDAKNSAQVQIRGMLSDVIMRDKSGTSGKDCRAAIMIVKIQ